MLLLGPAARSAIACALCALTLSTGPQFAISAEPVASAQVATLGDIQPGTIQPAAEASRTGPFRQASPEDEKALREAASKMEMPDVPPDSDLAKMLAEIRGSSNPLDHSSL